MSNTRQETTAYIALGSNLGDREQYLADALRQLDAHPDIYVAACSHIYETDPVGYVDQDAFLNMAAAVKTSLTPQELLAVMQQTEQLLGRVRDIRWGPRTIDLDLLLYGEQEVRLPDLIVPHPRMQERAFVLVPLADIFSHIPNTSFASLERQLAKLDGKEGVKLWKKMHWPSVSGHSAS
ncbi:2-amino-4-hydroxy-6-hydroxymethyldihydropteridine diphosphokinase [Paenibacillus lutrae]|uniref:2-amino-4-hydroxy-6-hydroxymethyldihydropteridine diphosphokinase n=1 Tax=Paenibacillus lutrae TaxID=2078573 RepID=A0A7X3K1K1_9BACL|nr:2-amino-4-hydroxy-6-hydroxymethyldihydropteridine diphosphokinase [Paenibacillus lutrae]MVP02212.1 2-amino-4-hydroxy-6-hydroxymethyldihydropteridine diphosphokinase [Paenibacillus lutrae]